MNQGSNLGPLHWEWRSASHWITREVPRPASPNFFSDQADYDKELGCLHITCRTESSDSSSHKSQRPLSYP